MSVYEWENVNVFFESLNQSDLQYVVLRNYEEMHTDHFFCDGHEDIDLLVDNAERFREAAHAYCKMWPEDAIHFVVFIGGECIPVDVRCVGDSYYDQKWEQNILEHRELASNGPWYVPAPEDYYFSLAYHILLQKMEIDKTYIDVLNRMAETLGHGGLGADVHLKNLHRFMKENNYRYVRCSDLSVPFRIDRVKSMETAVYCWTHPKKFVTNALKQSRLYEVARKKRYVFWRRQFDPSKGRFRDIDRLSWFVSKKYGENIYDQLSQRRTYRYIDRYDPEIRDMVPHLKSSMILKKKPELTTPVFTMWQQGMEQAPPVIQRCVESLSRLNREIVILNDDNLNEYVSIPEYIWDKYKAGKIGRAHFSDIVRVSLLAMYGGIWIDASVYIAAEVPRYMTEGFFVFRQSPQLREVRSFGNWWICAPAQNEIVIQTLAMLLCYWKHEEAAFDYYIFHCFWKKAVEKFEKLGGGGKDRTFCLSSVPVRYTDTTHLLLRAYSRKYDPQEWERMKQTSPVMKCSYKMKGMTCRDSYYMKLIEGKLD